MKKLFISLLTVLLLLNSCTYAADTPAPIPTRDTSFDTLDPYYDTVNPDVTAEAVTTDFQDMADEPDIIMTITEAAEETEQEPAAETVSEPDAEQETVRKYIYLTFDDGPSKYTESVLEILDKYDVKATFFVVGQFAGYYPERVRAIIGGGHTLGCHSATHDYRKIYASPEAIADDIAAWEDVITAALGYVPNERLYRFPGGSNCTAIDDEAFDGLYEAVTSLGYRGFDWTCANNDMWFGQMKEGQSKVDYLKESVINSLGFCGSTRILLVHETVADTVEMLDWMIEYLLEEGYTFATLDTFDGDYLFAS